MKILGELKNFLGMEIQRDLIKKTISLTQTRFIEKCLERFNLAESKPKSTPMVTRQVKDREIKTRVIKAAKNKSRTLTNQKHLIEKLLAVCYIYPVQRAQTSRLP